MGTTLCPKKKTEESKVCMKCLHLFCNSYQSYINKNGKLKYKNHSESESEVKDEDIDYIFKCGNICYKRKVGEKFVENNEFVKPYCCICFEKLLKKIDIIEKGNPELKKIYLNYNNS